jgi:hypothetical protein
MLKMDFRHDRLKLTLLVFMVVAMVLSAGAQQASQPVIFSSSQKGDDTPSTPSLSPQGPKSPDDLDTFQAPPSDFNFNPQSGSETMPPAPSAGNQRLQKILEERRNWALMTPAEIFGVTTPEQILGIQKRDAAGQVMQPTQMERWLARQNQPSAAATNGWQNGVAPASWNFSGNQEAGRFNPDDARQENARQFLNGFLNATPDNNGVSGEPNAKMDWLQSSGATPPPKINPQQEADMESFKQLLEPAPHAATATPSSGSAGKFLPAQTTTLNSLLDQPAVNPIGRSFTPLTSGIGMPQGVAQLPGITGQNNNIQQPPTTPSWTPQPAPWLSQGPQPFAVPQRKF